jgi:AcrR family transcriptional regulator
LRRRSPTERLDQLIEAAINVFMRLGYRRAQMADIAREMGVAPGTLYLYVESKEALFDLALRRACGNETRIDPDCLPLPTPSPAQILAQLKTEFTLTAYGPAPETLAESLAPTEVRAELTGVITDLYAGIHRRRRALSMIERSALDWPELHEYFYGRRRDLVQSLAAYLQRRIDQGCLRPVPDTDAAARLILETIAWFAYHRMDDPVPDSMSEETARATVVDTLVHAYLPDKDACLPTL